MCGIVGLIIKNGNQINIETLEAMTKSISHRGPSGEGIFISNNIGLGNRRLAIIDLNGGKQPLKSKDNQLIITYNGEIYNFQELKKELKTLGHFFLTGSDTEVVLQAYEEWGKDCVNHFRGMFAFAIADINKQEIFIARDQLGIKPLFFLSTEKFFAFSSELQAFKCIPDLNLEIDIEAIDQYLFLQYIPAPKTIYKDIQKLKPANRFVVSFTGEMSRLETYWNLEFKPDFHKTEVEWVEETEIIIKDSVRAHLISDVPYGAFLSGGIDSSCIVGYMAEILGSTVKTFTIGFDDDQYSELKYARIVSERWRTEHHYEILKPNALEILPTLAKHYGEPFGDSSAIPTYYVSKLAKEYVPMVLSGDGGDELFGGYGTYDGWISLITGRNRPVWRQEARKLAEVINPSRYPPRSPELKTWLHMINYFTYKSRERLWRKEYRNQCRPSVELFEYYFKKTKTYELAHKVQFMDINTYLPYDILTKVDIASMAHGLEARTPLVDIRVAEFAATIPSAMNIREDSNKVLQGKVILKKALEKIYDHDFIYRQKMGFAIPAKSWLNVKNNQNDRNTIREKLMDKNAKIYSFFQPREIERIINENKSGTIWLFLFLEEWLYQ